jgi:MFS family permease
MIVSSGLMPLISCVKIEEMMQLNTLLLILDFILLPFFGFISTKISREKLMLFASIAAALFSIPLFFFLEGASLCIIALIRVAFVFIGTAFAAPFHAFIQQMLPKEHRYSIISFGYALGCQLLGSPTASVSLWLFDLTKMPLSAGLYWMLLAVGSCMGVLSVLLKKKKESVVLSLN